MKWLALTDFTVKVARNAKEGSLTKAWKEADILTKWKATGWAKKIAAKEAKGKMSDFDRFKAKTAKQALRKKVIKKLGVKA